MPPGPPLRSASPESTRALRNAAVGISVALPERTTMLRGSDATGAMPPESISAVTDAASSAVSRRLLKSLMSHPSIFQLCSPLP